RAPRPVVVMPGLGGAREPGGGRGPLGGARLGLGGPPAGGAGLDGLLGIGPDDAGAMARARDRGQVDGVVTGQLAGQRGAEQGLFTVIGGSRRLLGALSIRIP